MTHHVMSVRTSLIVFGALMFLLVATVAGAYAPLPEWLHLPFAMTIAVIKAVLIILYFMHVRHSNKLTWVFSSAAFVWLGILLFITLSDYYTRGMLEIPGK